MICIHIYIYITRYAERVDVEKPDAMNCWNQTSLEDVIAQEVGSKRTTYG